jgi:protein-disulfide isomerase
VKAWRVIGRVLLFACLYELKLGTTFAELVIYEGRLSIEGVPFRGTGRFKFALIGERGAELWASEPMRLNVSDGNYAVRLGDSPQAPPIDEARLRGATPKLRIMFERPKKGWVLAGPDVALSGDKTADEPGGSNAAILAELREIRALLEGKPPVTRTVAPETVTVSVAGAPSMGSAEAPLVLVEFTDFQCPHCINFQREVFPALKAKHVETGKLRVVSRNLPQVSHPQAGPAAKAARCAEAQGKFWEMRERLLAAQGVLSPGAIRKAAEQSGLDVAQLEACAASAETAAALEKELQDAKAAGIVATPTFILGKMTGDRVTGVKLVGAQSLARLEIEMRRLLNEEK